MYYFKVIQIQNLLKYKVLWELQLVMINFKHESKELKKEKGFLFFREFYSFMFFSLKRHALNVSLQVLHPIKLLSTG